MKILDNASLRPSSGLTLAAWTKTSTNEERGCVIIGKQYGSSNHDSFALWYQYGYLGFVLEHGGAYDAISTAKSPANEWHYVVGTYDGSFMRLYVDGVEKANGTATGAIMYDSNPVLIGADSDQSNHTPDSGWNGLIDEVLIYNRALSQSEIMQVIPEFPVSPVLLAFMIVLSSAAMLGSRRLKNLKSSLPG